MENYFQMHMEKAQIDAISNLGLAHMGDSVFEILCRAWLCGHGGLNVGKLHADTVRLVKAGAQAKFADAMLPLTVHPAALMWPPPPNSFARAVASNIERVRIDTRISRVLSGI